LSLIEKAELNLDSKKAEELERKLRQEQLDFQDYLDQLQQLKKMGPLDQLMGMIPGMGALKAKMPEVNEKQTGRMEAMILSMTMQERRHPEILNGSRRRRIAKGSGTTVQDVNGLINNFMEVRKSMKVLTEMMSGGKSGKGGKNKKGKMRLPPFR
ncbi:MAG: signal recognition particle protein, partial [Armatimonadota bacterium]|nr:signal recognition particle protein [Armatimonadota bacterium]